VKSGLPSHRPRHPKPDRRRAQLLAASSDGITETIMCAHNFTIDRLAQPNRLGIPPDSNPAEFALISAVRLAEAVLHGPTGLASVPSSESARPIVATSFTALAAIVRTGRAIAGWWPIAGTITVARRRWAIARVGAEIQVDTLGRCRAGHAEERQGREDGR
jgi:hypothetical protein